ncbi:hypothetical protein EDB85DRAFT_2155702 [Lactarius pseudohatsudake]|nr:hypothetical protein EDB85DRAFT_2155702 [Lactarius pseudohatsudake]
MNSIGAGIDEEISKQFQLGTKVLSAEKVVVATEAPKDGKQDSADVVLVAVGHTFKGSASNMSASKSTHAGAS